LLFFAPAALWTFYIHQWGPAWAFTGFAAVGFYIIAGAGRYTFNEESVTHTTLIKTYRMRWNDVTQLKQGAGVLVLVGDGCRFAIAPPGYWSGPERLEAWRLLLRKMQDTGLPMRESAAAAYKWHKNVTVRL
jgi:hypothetical protein